MRHGATDWNLQKRAQGLADIPLNADGRRQAEQTADKLADYDIGAVYSSNLVRAYDTARAIASRHGLEVEVDPAFREIDQGDWEGLTTDEIRRRWPDRWGPARHHHVRPGGESPAAVRSRALAGLRRVVQKHPDDWVVVVSHGGTIRWLSAEALGWDDRRSARIRGLFNGDVVFVNGRLNAGHLVLSDLTRLDRQTVDLDDPNA